MHRSLSTHVHISNSNRWPFYNMHVSVLGMQISIYSECCLSDSESRLKRIPTIYDGINNKSTPLHRARLQDIILMEK